jgi:hypothetical protein
MLLTKRKVVVSIHYQQVETFLWQEICSTPPNFGVALGNPMGFLQCYFDTVYQTQLSQSTSVSSCGSFRAQPFKRSFSSVLEQLQESLEIT